MGRPKAVNIKTFSKYNILHTEKVKMYNGVSMTVLYPIKETKEWYHSIEVWASFASTFKRKKKNLTPSVTIPTITDQKTIEFLEKKSWHDYIDKNIDRPKSDLKEAIELLNKVYPNHKKVYFYELSSILYSYASGTFINYDKDGNVEEPTEHEIKERKYYTHKYNKFGHMQVPEIKEAFDIWSNLSDKDGKEADQAFEKYYILAENYAYENNCLDSVFLNIGQNGVGYPVAFTHNTAEWSKEKYGKLLGYAHAGEILFVATPDTIYFEIKRHY
jgi:hypothetical protein